MFDHPERVTLSGKPADPGSEHSGAPKPIDPRTGQHGDYWVLSERERAKGFLRPVRRTYTHVTCGTNTTMGLALAETYARDPTFYGATFCCACGSHFALVTAAGPQFFWTEAPFEAVGADLPT